MLNISKNIGFKTALTNLKQISGLLRDRGWAEANSGNISINITDLCEKIKIQIPKSSRINLKKAYNNLGSCFILITSSGSKMRDIAEYPVSGLCLLYINEPGNAYYNIPLDKNADKIPSSELFTHLEIQNLLSGKKANEKVVLHAHPDEMIALTHLKNYKTEININKLVSSMLPEVPVLIPEGIGFVPHLVTGSEKLAEETTKKINKHKIVIWEKHGCISVGKDLNDAFDIIDVINKCIKIFFLCNSTGNKSGGLNVYQVKELKYLNKK
jgi:rhamnulose-1-phosphate aldolase